MATPGFARSSSRKTRLLLRIALGALLLLLLLALGAGTWFWRAAHAALPQLDGTVRAQGLGAPATVVRDAQGVPHISAGSMADLLFAQGYVTAQDRLWQMDTSRRWAAGELAEILGTSQLRHDREQRVLGLRQATERSATQLSPQARADFEAYARGVNAFIESHRDRLPIEFRILRYQPKPWTVVDSLLCGVNLVQMLTHYEHLSAIARGQVTAKLGPELAADLYPNSSWRDRPPSAAPESFEPSTTPPLEGEETQPRAPARRRGVRPRRSTRRALTWAGPPPIRVDAEPVVPGSNNWTVSGARTASGKPLLSNDMHLFNTIPNTWYEAHLTAGTDPAFDVAGVTVPGLPFVIAGHNRRIAWGFTNLGATVEDVYIETLNGKGEYQAGAEWRPLARRSEVIHVKGEPDVTVDVLATRHGPVISELIPGETRTLALRWTLYELPTTLPFREVNSAGNWQEFRAAFAQFQMPSQNVVYADVDGHIGYQAVGRIPMRPAGDDASVPVPGNDNAHEWTGYLPFDALPSVYDPASGIVATANGRIAPDGYPHTLAYEWGPPYRTERIYRVLSSPRKFVAADMLKLQTDVYSAYDQLCADRFVYAIDHAQNASPRARAAADVMRGWNGRVTAESKPAQVVAVTRREVWRMLLEPRLGPATVTGSIQRLGSGWGAYRWFMSSVAFENLLTQQPARWLPQGYAGFGEVIAAAADKAVTDDTRERPWGKNHRVELRHPVFGALPLIGQWFGTGSHPWPGNGSTVKQVAGLLGPSQRFTANLADLDQSTMNIVTGQSGQIFSPHWMDQWSSWYEGKTTFALPFTEAAVKAAARHTLVLQP